MNLKLTEEEKENYYNRPCRTKDCCGLASIDSYYCKKCREDSASINKASLEGKE